MKIFLLIIYLFFTSLVYAQDKKLSKVNHDDWEIPLYPKFDKKKRDDLKAKGKAQAEKWMAQIEYQPLSDLYDELSKAEFPNKANKSGFKTEAQKFQKIYDDIEVDPLKPNPWEV